MSAQWRLLPALLLVSLQALWMATPHPCGQAKEATSADCHPCCAQPCPTDDPAPAPGGQETLCAMACAAVGMKAGLQDLHRLPDGASLWAPTLGRYASLLTESIDHVPIARARDSITA